MKRRTLAVAMVVPLCLVACTSTGTGGVSGPCGPDQKRDDQSGECVPVGGADVPSAADGGVDDSSVGPDGLPPAPDMATYQDPWKDRDGDSVPNGVDNCFTEPNQDQRDADSDRVGDVCDNCPKTANRGQRDRDRDGEGDACEAGKSYDSDRDTDGDGVTDFNDNCRKTPNKMQADPDGDNVGTACDNCPQTANFDQANADGDEEGDACEPTPMGAGMVCKRKTSDFKQVKPNIYFVIDRSTSMKRGDGTGKTRMERAKNGLDQIAAALHDKVRIGMSTYPCARANDACSKLNKEFLAVGDHTKNKIVASYRSNYSHGFCPHGNTNNLPGLDIETGGKHCTPTGSALKDVHKNKRHTDTSDPLSGKRAKAVVLITDGCGCGNCGPGEDTLANRWAGRMKKAGIPVYTVGFNSTCPELNDIAKAGGTNAGGSGSGNPRYYSATNASQLAGVLSNISKQVISCSYTLKAPRQGIDPGKIWVKIDGSFVAPSEFSYDAKNKTLKLSKTACQKLQNARPGSSMDPLEIVLGCPTQCQKSEEVCDYQDNDCDTQVDEGCEGCQPEQCDGMDNDCDGRTDEGCPNCTLNGESCSADGDCCSGRCADGICKPPCRPQGAACTKGSQCCSGSCSATGGRTGQCIGG